MPDLTSDLLHIARHADSQRMFRQAALACLRAQVTCEAAFFHALNPRVPLDSGVWLDLDLRVVAESARHWDQYAVDLARIRDVAMERGGVAVDVDVLGRAALQRLHYHRHFARPLGVTALLLAHLTFAGRIVSVVGLARRRKGAGFSARDQELMRSVVPALSVGDAAHLSRPGERGAPIARLRCEDGRLTPRQRELVELVALGRTNAELARALGISPNSARNQLTAVFRKLGAGNRAEVVRLAVLR